MSLAADHLWLIPALPLLVAALTAVCRRERRSWSAGLGIGSMALAFALSVAAFLETVAPRAGDGVFREVRNFAWFQLGETSVKLGWVLDPLTASMLVMVSLVGLVIFIYSVGYLARDGNFTRFFCFMSLFAAAMLGLVLANSLLLLFICWELVGLTSYLLIGFWFHRPSAAAAAKKAFLVTRIGDLALFVGMLWLYRETGTLLFYDAGNGCLEQSALANLVMRSLGCGMAVSTAIALLIFAGAIGKSGQLPLHVWLPDAMEGPTPVSALIHAATMVAAGVFLVARMYPLISVTEVDLAVRTGFTTGIVAREAILREGKPTAEVLAQRSGTPAQILSGRPLTPALSPSDGERVVEDRVKGHTSSSSVGLSSAKLEPAAREWNRPSTATSLKVITWIGAITAVFAALIAVAQTDIKRILAYSTVSQLGYMMLGLGVGGVAVGLFHLLTHGFFKALLFLGAGSVIHGCRDEQDIRRMGGLRKFMPVTFATYAIGMLALAGVIPLAGFWSKDGILHAAHAWSPSHWPFYLGLFGALVTGFYMTRQVCCVFLGGRGNPECGTRNAEHETRSASRTEWTSPEHPLTPALSPSDGGRVSEWTSPEHPLTPALSPSDGERVSEWTGEGNSAAIKTAERDLSSAAIPHDGPRVMTLPLILLAVFAALLGLLGTPVWPWLQTYLDPGWEGTAVGQVIPLMLISTVVAAAGIGLGWLLYGRSPPKHVEIPDVLERLRPAWFQALREGLFVDALYDATAVRLTARFCRCCHTLDAIVLEGLVTVAAYLVLGVSWLARLVDEYAVNLGFDQGCGRLRASGGFLSRWQDGQIQNYLRVLGVSLTVFLLLLLWGCRG